MTTIGLLPPRWTRDERGNVLLAVIIIVLGLAALALAFLETGVQETKSNTAAGERSRVSYVAETGINEAVVDIISGGDGNLGTLDYPIEFGGGEFVTRAADMGGDTWKILSLGRMNDTAHAVEVVLAPKEIPFWSRALFGDLDLGAGGTVFTDSYDSDLGTYASQATKTHPVTGDTYSKAGGDIGSNRNIILRGGVKILGNATPGPGHSVQIASTNVYVDGSTSPALEPQVMPPLDLTPTVASSGDYLMKTAHSFTGGTYNFSSFTATADAEIRFSGDVVLYVTGDITMDAKAKLIVEKDASVVIYHSGTTAYLAGQGVVNETQTPASFRLFSSATTVTLAGTSDFYGAVYAPNGYLVPAGQTDLYGSFVARGIDIEGEAYFHYDEALSRFTPDNITRMTKVSWRLISTTTAIAVIRGTKTMDPIVVN
ncbi:MAG: collagen-binding domain-containing protein [Planctomycetota bacterium]